MRSRSRIREIGICQRLAVVIILFIVAKGVEGGSCCVGGGAVSFIQLRDLQSYQLGISTSFRDVFGWYNQYGDLVNAEKNQTLNTQVGVGARLTDSVEASLILPWVTQIRESFGASRSSTNVGDVLMGGRYRVYRSLFHDDPYPTLFLLAGVKLPTGIEEHLSTDGQLIPGTGNGIWEPYLGGTLEKDFGWVVFNFNGTYTVRASHRITSVVGMVDVKEGDRIELSEFVTFIISRRLSVTGGGIQDWYLSRQNNGSVVPDSDARVASLSVASSYFINPYWSVAGGVSFALPIAMLGLNQPASRAYSLTSIYSFF